jgi:WD40 repeat protein
LKPGGAVMRDVRTHSRPFLYYARRRFQRFRLFACPAWSTRICSVKTTWMSFPDIEARTIFNVDFMPTSRRIAASIRILGCSMDTHEHVWNSVIELATCKHRLNLETTPCGFRLILSPGKYATNGCNEGTLRIGTINTSLQRGIE